MKKSRRKFIKNTVSASTATFLAPSIISASVFGANDRINAVVLGVNGRGKNHISSLMKQKMFMSLNYVIPIVIYYLNGSVNSKTNTIKMYLWSRTCARLWMTRISML